MIYYGSFIEIATFVVLRFKSMLLMTVIAIEDTQLIKMACLWIVDLKKTQNQAPHTVRRMSQTMVDNVSQRYRRNSLWQSTSHFALIAIHHT